MCRYSPDNNIARVTVNGNSNDITAYLGKHESGAIDNDETGDNDALLIVVGNSNTPRVTLTDDNGNGGQI